MVFDQVDFVQHYYDIARKQLCDYDALGRLRLNAFGYVDDQEHDIDDLCPADDGLDQRGMPWTVHQSHL